MSGLLHKLGWASSSNGQKPRYHPLTPEHKEIRILVLRGVDNRGRICCELQHVSLLNKPTPYYEALSWTWGNAKKTTEICLDGQYVSVPVNAEEVLRRVGIGQELSYLWLDAICINQEDIAERSQQVALMKDVYQMAARVLIWLGDMPRYLCQAMHVNINLLLAQARDLFPTEEEMIAFIFPREGDINRGKLSQDPLPQCNWQALNDFFGRSWFRRVWVVQEVVLANDALCFFGSSWRPWSDVRQAATWLKHRWLAQPGLAEGVTNTAFIYIQTLGALDPSSAMTLSIDRDCTVPHDKIYGMLGLIEKDPSGKYVPTMAPDYTMPVEKVYMMATRTAFENGDSTSGKLMLLELAQSLVPDNVVSSSAGWPSWVPHYDWKHDPLKGSPTRLSAIPGISGNNLPVNIRCVRDERVLSVQDLMVDGIRCSVGKGLTPRTLQNMKDDLTMHARWRSMALAVGVPELDFAATLVANRNLINQPARDDAALMTAYRAYMSQCEIFAAGGSRFTMIADSQRWDGHIAFTKAMWLQNAHRKFCLTSRNLMLMSPEAARPGDFVCIVFGTMAPLILRQEGEYWRLIGSAYVHDIMEGEYVRQLEHEGGLEAAKQWFDIH